MNPWDADDLYRVLQEFEEMVSEATARTDDAELPGQLTSAVVDVLEVTGASLSTTGPIRMPLAASGEGAAYAEKLQITLGDGPCLAATANGEPVIADVERLFSEWPAFARAVVERTRVRSVASFPLRTPAGETFGALDLYSDRADASTLQRNNEVVLLIADRVATILLSAPTVELTHGVVSHVWFDQASVNERMTVWVAVGVVTGTLPLSGSDAVAVMRGYAFTHDLTLDEVAAAISARELKPYVLLD